MKKEKDNPFERKIRIRKIFFISFDHQSKLDLWKNIFHKTFFHSKITKLSEYIFNQYFPAQRIFFVYLNFSESKPFDWYKKERRGYVVDWELTGCTLAKEIEEVDVVLMILDDGLLLPPTVLDFPIILLSSNSNNFRRRPRLRCILLFVDVFMLAFVRLQKNERLNSWK